MTGEGVESMEPQWAADFKRLFENCEGNLRGREVNLLYALERRSQRATEFRWDQDALSHHPGNRARTALPLKARWMAAEVKEAQGRELVLERQHLVPLSHGKAMYGEEDLRPTQNHAVNSVCNLTWLTRRQNTLNEYGGLGKNVLDLSTEPAANLRARGLELRGGFDALRALLEEEDVDDAEGEDRREQQVQHFKSFLEARKKWIGDTMEQWLKEDALRIEEDLVLLGELSGDGVSVAGA